MTDIKESINTTYDGTFLSVVCENPEKVLLVKSWGGGGHSPPSPPRNYPPALKLAKLQLKTADILNHVNGVRRQNYGELQNTGSDTSINVFTNFSLQWQSRTIER